MSHRKFEAPRHGSLAFRPKKRAYRMRGRISKFPVDDKTKPVHLTGFMAYKAGMTHIVRDLDKPGSKMHKKEVVEPVTILETPPMVIVGIVGYRETHVGLKTTTTVWAKHLSSDVRRRFIKNWYRSKRKAFTQYAKKMADGNNFQQRVDVLEKKSEIIRVLAHTPIGHKRLSETQGQVIELQVNGGTVKEKIEWAIDHLEKPVDVHSVFAQNQYLDVVGITKGHGVEGVTHRWGTKKLPRKTHKGLRKVACIGAWHPSRVMYSVARAGQNGDHKRTERNKQVYRIGKAGDQSSATTDFDLTKKAITPVGGFPRYGYIKSDWVMIKGFCMGPQRRAIMLRTALQVHTKRSALTPIDLKFIDTSSKQGHGRFQTTAERKAFMGPLKREVQARAREDLEAQAAES